MTKKYRTLFVGVLEQESNFSTGGTTPTGGFVDSPVARDGQGRLTIRGTTLAGALQLTARRLAGVENLPESICYNGKQIPGKGDSWERRSRWRTYNAHPVDEENQSVVELRQGVGIRQDTGAAAERVLFDVETIARGTQWDFMMEVETGMEGGEEAERYAVAALKEWQRGRCYLGRDVARGLGWMVLKDLKVYRLTEDHVELWPDSTQTLEQSLKNLGVEPVEIDHLEGMQSDQAWWCVELEGVVKAGENVNGYGVDPIAVGGHASNATALEWNSEHFLIPDSLNPENMPTEYAPDNMLALHTTIKGQSEPFIPGSGIRGPLRHVLSRLLRMQGEQVQDPNVSSAQEPQSNRAEKDKVEELFGSVTSGAALLIRDAYLDGSKWKCAWLQHHAEDEFTAGAYSSSKFDRVVLVEGKFRWRMVLEAQTQQQCCELFERLAPVLRMAQQGQLAVGGGQWRGCGWAAWEIEQAKLTQMGKEQGECVLNKVNQ